MPTTTLKLVTIIAESVLEDRIVTELKRLGATGYSISSARGEGSRGVRASEWEGDNVRIETIVGPVVADRILDSIAAAYFAQFAVIVWISDVAVLRGEKYL